MVNLFCHFHFHWIILGSYYSTYLSKYNIIIMNRIPKQFLRSLPPSLLAVTTLTSYGGNPKSRTENHPNILLIMVDQMQTPPEGYGPLEGAVPELKEILGFRSLTPGNTYTQYFPGLMRLRQNSVILKKHYTASAASVPSRCCIMTGQFPNITGVEQTDGLFKAPGDVHFLDSLGAPTIGDMFRAAGYTTHYFGKWHVSDPKPSSFLDPWGFSDYGSSYPEPHGGGADNLGVYRDVVFGDKAVEFLNQMGADTTQDPWLMVASFVNPHDVSAWPIQWQVFDTNGVVSWTNYPPPLSIPAPGDYSLYGTVQTMVNGDSTVYETIRVPLNPAGFPQDNSSLPPTYNEILSTKPECQQDFLYKWGLGWGAKTDANIGTLSGPLMSPHPFRLQKNYAQDWALSYVQFYFYLHYLADIQINRVLQALDSNGLAENTIVIFLSDHGDMTASHGGIIQKWHNAYEESIRVPMIISSPLINPDSQEMREITATTSSIDFAPTLLGLAGIEVEEVRNTLQAGNVSAPLQDFPGVDLSPYIKGISTGPILGNDGNPRTGVLFISDDMITELGSSAYDDPYDLFLHRVDSTIALGVDISEGTVRQPNNVKAFCTGDWKLVRYVDPNGNEADQWELYCLVSDPTETTNLVDYSTDIVRTDVTVPGMTREQIQAINDSLRIQLAYALGYYEPGASPNQVRLFQNLPNPFIKQTTLSFYLPEHGRARLEVTDLTGRVVRVLMDQTLPQGTHIYTLDASTFPSGVYFYTLNFGNQLLAKKMILVKQ